MIAIKVKYRVSSADSGRGVICYQIVHERVRRVLSAGYQLFAGEWDNKRSMVVIRPGSERAPLLLSIRKKIYSDVARLAWIDKRLAATRLSYTADDVVAEFRRYAGEYSLFGFMRREIANFRQRGSIRTSETYTAALNSFRKFRGDRDVMLDCLTPEIMEAYEAWHRQRGNTPNTISFYTRILRAAYNRAVEEGAVENRFPFRRVYTGVDKTVKRALSLSVIGRIKALDLSRLPGVEYARDMFLMSFYLRGMSFVDMAYLRKSDLRYGYVTYRRRKTGRQLTIRWTAEMRELLEKYPENPTQYLLPIIMTAVGSERSAYRNAGYSINRRLKQVARMAGVEMPLTMYVARHSWASAAKMKQIPIRVISEGLGHDNETTTQIYLASLDTSVIDSANDMIIKSV